MLVVSDNSPVRYLRVLDCAYVLPSLFGRILIPRAVLEELQHPNTPAVVRTWLADPPAWLEVHPIVGRPAAALATLETGEQEAIVLAQELQASIRVDLPEVLARLLTTNFRILRVIIDDALARDAKRKRQAPG